MPTDYSKRRTVEDKVQSTVLQVLSSCVASDPIDATKWQYKPWLRVVVLCALVSIICAIDR